MFRKTISTALASLLLVGCASLGAHAAETARYEEAIGAMGALRIMIGDDTGAFRPDDPIKRSEFAKVAIHALGMEDIASSFTKSSFPDVRDDHWAVGYIGAAVKQGIVIGDTDGNFRPDDSISFEEAVTVLVRMAGYEVAAQSQGGYPTGYLAIANSGGILDRVPVTMQKAVDRATVAQMTFGALNMKMMEKNGVGENADYAVTDNTLLGTRLHAEEVRGTLEASSRLALSGDEAGEGYVRIDGKTYKTDISADALLGHSIRGLVRTDDTENILFFLTSDTARTKTMTLSASDVESVSASAVIYEGANGRVTETLADGAKLMVNGKSADTAAVPTVGHITLLTNTNGKYNTVFVWDYETEIVESVYPASHKIITKDGETLTLDKENKDIYFTVQDADGKSLSLSDIAKNDILSVAKSADGRTMRILVSRTKAEGTVEEISDDKITVSGKTFTKSPHFTGSLPLGEAVTMRIDALGLISYAETQKTEGTMYAYLLATEKTTGLEGKYLLSVFDRDGNTRTMVMANKLRLDGTPSDASAVSETLGAFRGLVTLETNAEGQVTSICRAADETASFPETHANRFVQNATLTDAVYKRDSMKIGFVSIDENTVFFSIPDGETDSSKYAVHNYTQLTDKTAYNAYVYDMKEDLTAGVVVLTDSESSIAPSSPILVVNRISSAQNEDGTPTDKLYGLSEGKTMDFLAAEGVSLSALREGDVIQYRTDGTGKISEIHVLLSAENRETEGKVALSDTVETVYGKVTARFADSVNVSVEDGGAENYKLGTAPVYRFDSTAPSGRVQLADASHITKYAEDSSRIFLHLEDGQVKGIVVVK